MGEFTQDRRFTAGTSRAFRRRAVPAAVLARVLAAAGRAPSAFNLQPWRAVVCRTADARRAVAACCHGQPHVAATPVLAVVAAVPADLRAEAPRAVDELIARGRWPAAERRARIAQVRALVGRRAAERRALATTCATIYAHQLALAARAEGLGSYWLTGFDERALRRALGLPAAWPLVAVIGFGHPARPSEPLPRRPTDELVGFERWPD